MFELKKYLILKAILLSLESYVFSKELSLYLNFYYSFIMMFECDVAWTTYYTNAFCRATFHSALLN